MKKDTLPLPALFLTRAIAERGLHPTTHTLFGRIDLKIKQKKNTCTRNFYSINVQEAYLWKRRVLLKSLFSHHI